MNPGKPKYRDILFLLILLIYGCQPEEIVPLPVEAETKRLIVSAERIPQVTQTLLQKMGARDGLSQFSVNDGTDEFPFKIDWDRIKLVVEVSGQETYAFSMTVNDGDPKTFYNLVIRYSENKEVHQPFILKYTMSDEFFPQYLATGSLVGFEGEIQRILIKEGSGGSNRRGTASLDPGDLTLGEPCPVTTKVKAPGSGDPGADPTGDNGSLSDYECQDYIITTKWYTEVCAGPNDNDCVVTLVETTISFVTECGWVSSSNANGTEDECEPDEGEIPILDEEPGELKDDDEQIEKIDYQKATNSEKIAMILRHLRYNKKNGSMVNMFNVFSNFPEQTSKRTNFDIFEGAVKFGERRIPITYIEVPMGASDRTIFKSTYSTIEQKELTGFGLVRNIEYRLECGGCSKPRRALLIQVLESDFDFIFAYLNGI